MDHCYYWRREKAKEDFLRREKEKKPTTQLPSLHINHRNLRSRIKSISKGFTKRKLRSVSLEGLI
jgi:hypothetical protein